MVEKLGCLKSNIYFLFAGCSKLQFKREMLFVNSEHLWYVCFTLLIFQLSSKDYFKITVRNPHKM